ncbi:MAG: hypothetical protein ABI234_04095 [Ktedonobacteraceae bacterium]
MTQQTTEQRLASLESEVTALKKQLAEQIARVEQRQDALSEVDRALLIRIDSVIGAQTRLERDQKHGFDELQTRFSAGQEYLTARSDAIEEDLQELRTGQEYLAIRSDTIEEDLTKVVADLTKVVEMGVRHEKDLQELRTGQEYLIKGQEYLTRNQEYLTKNQEHLTKGQEYLTERTDAIEEDLIKVVEMGVKHREAIDLLLAGQQQILDLLIGGKPKTND